MKRFLLEQLPAYMLVTVLALIVVHAPLTVWLGTVFPGASLAVKAWKEVLIVIAGVLVGVGLWRRGTLGSFIRRPVIALLMMYVALHLLLTGIYPQSFQSTVAGLLIDLRYVLYFAVVYGFLTLYPRYKGVFVRVGIAGACVVVGFAALQLLLPKDTLTAIGYGDTTIQPYLTVDKNPDFIRFSSTLRGPNPLGAYAVMVLTGVVAFGIMAGRAVKDWRVKLLHAGLGVFGVIALWISYSRSAWLGLAVSIAMLLVMRYWRKPQPRTWGVIAACIVVLAAGTLAIKDTVFFQNVILHNNPTTGADIDSNTAHAESLITGLQRTLMQPLGAGVGSTGSASLLGESGMIIENQYLMIAHETGWAGLALFVTLFIVVLRQLWLRRNDWLARTLFASGIGLAVIGLLLPVWADDTVSIIWWGLAAVSMIGGEYGKHTANQKTKRTA